MSLDPCLNSQKWAPGTWQGKKEKWHLLSLSSVILSNPFNSHNSPRTWYYCFRNTEDWAPKNWSSQSVVLEKTLESLLGCKEIKPVNPKGDQPWIFTGRADAKAEALILWPPIVKSRLIGKYSDAGKDWGQEKMGATDDEIVGWHHQLNGYESEQTPGDSAAQGTWPATAHGFARSPRLRD